MYQTTQSDMTKFKYLFAGTTTTTIKHYPAK